MTAASKATLEITEGTVSCQLGHPESKKKRRWVWWWSKRREKKRADERVDCKKKGGLG